MIISCYPSGQLQKKDMLLNSCRSYSWWYFLFSTHLTVFSISSSFFSSDSIVSSLVILQYSLFSSFLLSSLIFFLYSNFSSFLFFSRLTLQNYLCFALWKHVTIVKKITPQFNIYFLFHTTQITEIIILFKYPLLLLHLSPTIFCKTKEIISHFLTFQDLGPWSMWNPLFSLWPWNWAECIWGTVYSTSICLRNSKETAKRLIIRIRMKIRMKMAVMMVSVSYRYRIQISSSNFFLLRWLPLRLILY